MQKNQQQEERRRRQSHLPNHKSSLHSKDQLSPIGGFMIRSDFTSRHIGPSDSDISEMLHLLKVNHLEELIVKSTPSDIRNVKSPLNLEPPLSEVECLERARHLASKNQLFKSYIGMGYYDCHTPSVILRNILENPGWYTAYTPYQAEISQGRMEALLNFQTMIIDLTGMDIANASLLDEGTAAAEAVTMARGIQKKNKSHKILVDHSLFPQSLEILKTRCEPIGIEIVHGKTRQHDFEKDPVFSVITQYPSGFGSVRDWTEITQRAHDHNAVMICGADLLSLCVLKPPGEWGADIVYGTTQRFGVPVGFGGPHAAYIACRETHKRLLPGRLIGVSKDSHGNPALRLALQTREQHIRREKATSNICTAQVLLAVMASMYAVYHGPQGLKNIAQRIHKLTCALALGLERLGYQLVCKYYFDTLTIVLDSDEVKAISNLAEREKVNLAKWDEGHLGLSLDETSTDADVERLLSIFNSGRMPDLSVQDLLKKVGTTVGWPSHLTRTTDYLTHPVFHSYHSETEMLRYIHSLEVKDLCLNKAMIPLGSCTMKLNATTEMIPVTWPKFNSLHPFVPIEQADGYREMILELERWLCEITGFAAISLQPNAGSQGELAGLLVIRKYHQNQKQRNICLIPSSAHGTNPASTVMAGMKVVVVQCDHQGNIDLKDLKAKAKAHSENLAALMITYPSTHGVFEESLLDICDVIHQNGGQVYMDGANLNALIGFSQPGGLGPDVCHLNLHKTFCIPHGGGGPGIGPIGVAEHLKDYLPGHSLMPECGSAQSISAISAAPWGSASLLPISWAYVAMMGTSGLQKATEVAILNANYIAKKLEPHYPVLYTSRGGWVAHECIIDARPFKESANVSVDDIAKRLIDYGFHAPTMSWPVSGTLMIEPTESESKQELDRFCEAMIEIRNEIREIEEGNADRINNVLSNAPHSLDQMVGDSWDYPYSRSKASYSLPWVKKHKFWSPVSRVDNVHGDRHLVCACPPMETYEDPATNLHFS